MALQNNKTQFKLPSQASVPPSPALPPFLQEPYAANILDINFNDYYSINKSYRRDWYIVEHRKTIDEIQQYGIKPIPMELLLKCHWIFNLCHQS